MHLYLLHFLQDFGTLSHVIGIFGGNRQVFACGKITQKDGCSGQTRLTKRCVCFTQAASFICFHFSISTQGCSVALMCLCKMSLLFLTLQPPCPTSYNLCSSLFTLP